MKKILLTLSALLLLAACGESGGETKYQTYGGVTSTSGDYCFMFDYEDLDSIPLDVIANGDSADIAMTLKLFRSQKDISEVREGAELKPFYAVISGRDNLDSLEIRLDAEAATVEQVRGILNKPGDSISITFKGKAPKAYVDSLDNKKVWTSLLF